MSRATKITQVVIAIGVFSLVARMTAQSTPPLIFQSGWENGGGTGCDFTKISDNRAWDDYGPSSTCNTPHVADIVTDQRHDGTSSLRVNFAPDGTLNGPDFRIVKDFGDRSQVYVALWVKWSSNWVWASQDHKIVIFGSSAATQNVYLNIRGQGGGGSRGRVVVHVIPMNTAVSDASVDITPGVWHLFEMHLVAGTHGRVETKVDGRMLNLVTEAGSVVNPLDLNTGSAFGSIKIDTTYNNYAYPSGLGLNMNMWYDDVAMSTTGWIGGGGSTPTIPAPSSPTNVRVIR